MHAKLTVECMLNGSHDMGVRATVDSKSL
jgi:hypothetical protein